MSISKHDETGHKVLRYLDHHHLDHTPEHYLFAHRVLFGRDESFTEAVETITEGGVRITQDQVRQLAPGGSRSGETIRAMVPELDGLTLRVLDIAGDAADATGELNRTLVASIAAMLGTQGGDVRPFITSLIDQTAGAEIRLRQAVRHARDLRDDLNALHAAASRDRLTGLLDRAAMEQRLSAMAAGSSPWSLAIVDLDHFRAVNDTWGQAVGNRVLRAVAETLRDNCLARPIGRWDGDVFMVLFDATGAVEAGRLVDAARVALAARRMKLRENDKPLGMISFSAGVVSSRSRDPTAIIDAAEHLLRQAKQQGRNRIASEKPAVGL